MKHLNRSAFGQNILAKFEGMVRSGGIPKPEWFDAVHAHPPPTLYRLGCASTAQRQRVQFSASSSYTMISPNK